MKLSEEAWKLLFCLRHHRGSWVRVEKRWRPLLEDLRKRQLAAFTVILGENDFLQATVLDSTHIDERDWAVACEMVMRLDIKDGTKKAAEELGLTASQLAMLRDAIAKGRRGKP